MRKTRSDGFIIEDETESWTAWSWYVFGAATVAGAVVATLPAWLAAFVK